METSGPMEEREAVYEGASLFTWLPSQTPAPGIKLASGGARRTTAERGRSSATFQPTAANRCGLRPDTEGQRPAGSSVVHGSGEQR